MSKIQKFIQDHRGFFWWIHDIKIIDTGAIVEATLSLGTHEDKKELLQIIGKKAFKKEFESIITSRRRSNLEPRTIHYWSLYLSR